MTDITSAIEPKSDQLNSDDLALGPKTITITKVTIKESGDQRVSIFFEGDNGKPWKPAKTMTRLLGALWKTRESADFVGKSVTLYRDDTVTWGALAVGGIRVSHVSHIEDKTIVMVRQKKGVSAPVTVLPLKMDAKSLQRHDTQPDAPTGISKREFADRLRELIDHGTVQAANDYWDANEDVRSQFAEDKIFAMSEALAAKIEKENA